MTLRLAGPFIMAFLSASPAWAAQTGGHEQDGGALPQFDVSTFPTQVFWLFIMFAVVYSVVKAVIIPQIGGTIDAREAHIREELLQAGTLTEQARQAVASYNDAIKTARLNAQATTHKAREDMARELAQSEAHQRASLQEMREQVSRDINAKKAAALTSMEQEAQKLVESLSQKLLATSSKTSKTSSQAAA